MEKGKYKHTEKIKKEISRRHKEWWNKNRDSEIVKERNKKLSLAMKGRKMSEEQKTRISKKLKGRIFSNEHKKKLSLAGKNRKVTWGNKIVESRRRNNNYTVSDETKDKMRKSHILFLKNNPDFFDKHSIRMTGDKNPAWMGGISYEPYTKDFNKIFKESIKKRDGCCMLCNITLEDLRLLKRIINIHHINYNKRLTIPENCVTLCNECHGKTCFNRKQWTQFFHSLMNERYGYEYSNNKIVLEIC